MLDDKRYWAAAPHKQLSGGRSSITRPFIKTANCYEYYWHSTHSKKERTWLLQQRLLSTYQVGRCRGVARIAGELGKGAAGRNDCSEDCQIVVRGFTLGFGLFSSSTQISLVLSEVMEL